MAMEEEMLSIISDGVAEASDANTSVLSLPNSNKHVRNGLNASPPRFKGVVQQQNGHWGAQIYANHQRIWLGTFKSNDEAAMAYDSAAMKLRSGDPHRNFPWTKLSIEELNFQSAYSTEQVLNMIKDGSYQSKFADFLRTRIDGQHVEAGLEPVPGHPDGGLACRQLFQKELTPSDVGKLNRLVIPKKFAIKYFPRISENMEEMGGPRLNEDVQLVFYDRSMRSWKFRYCYWSSSHSFVFTRGWNRFVKEKELKPNDMITFYICEYRDQRKEGRTFCMIDVQRKEKNGGLSDEKAKETIEMRMKGGDEVQVGDEMVCNESDEKISKVEEEEEEEEEDQVEDIVDASMICNIEKKGFRLFGVEIN